MSEFSVVGEDRWPSLSLPHLRILRVQVSDALYVIDAETDGSERPNACIRCGVIGDVIAHDRPKAQQIRDTPIHGMTVRLVFHPRRYRCKACDRTFTLPLAWMDERRYATRRLVAAVERDALNLTNLHVAHKYGIDDKTVKNIWGAYAQREEASRKFDTPRYLGIDEIHVVGKPRGIFTNIDQLAIVEMLPDRNKPTVAAYLKSLEDRKRIEVVAMDMWRGYERVVRDVLPQAVIVVDKFHVVRMANGAMEKVRKNYRATLDAKARRKLKGDRFTLLRRRHELDVFQVGEIELWKCDFPDLIRAYELKERFFYIYDASSRAEGLNRLTAWEKSIPDNLRPHFMDLLTALQNWRREVLAYFDHRITNAYTESMNRIVRDIDRNGRGYSFEALRAKVLYGQEFRKKAKRASVSRAVRGAIRMVVPGSEGFFDGSNASDVTFGADMRLVADYLERAAKQQ